MKSYIPRLFAAAVLLSSLAFTGISQEANAPLTNASIVKLVKAGFRDKTVIAIIGSRPVNFDLAPDRLVELKRSGVSERVILAMLSRDVLRGEGGFADDNFFDDSAPLLGKNGGVDNPGKNDGGVDIFGSGSGTRGRTRGRGMSGSVQDDTVTTGSATVRIIRPQNEGGAPAKLERTPTLTNESIIELVEAGFSEGTIIRRIEQSPVNFDLSPPKISELKRRRVGERIIASMSTAMGQESENNGSNPGN